MATRGLSTVRGVETTISSRGRPGNIFGQKKGKLRVTIRRPHIRKPAAEEFQNSATCRQTKACANRDEVQRFKGG